MNLNERISALTDRDTILEFCNFITSQTQMNGMLDYKKMDLMQIYQLLHQVVVIDYRDGIDNGILINYSGTAIDENFGHVLQGNYLEDAYTGIKTKDKLIEFCHAMYQNFTPFYVSSCVHHEQPSRDITYKHTCGLFFPCSSDGLTANYGIGIVDYSFVEKSTPPQYEQLSIYYIDHDKRPPHGSLLMERMC
ncbi:MAG: hypothetical protein OQK24_03935 [Magnetovibrio sp.]|nr:hypothetical protein [Magnetovibrio sp.]